MRQPKEIGVMRLPAKEHRGLPATTRCWDPLSEPPEAATLPASLCFKPPSLWAYVMVALGNEYIFILNQYYMGHNIYSSALDNTDLCPWVSCNVIFNINNLGLAHTDVVTYLTMYLKIDIWVYICIFLHLSLMIFFIPRSENTSCVFKDFCFAEFIMMPLVANDTTISRVHFVNVDLPQILTNTVYCPLK